MSDFRSGNNRINWVWRECQVDSSSLLYTVSTAFSVVYDSGVHRNFVRVGGVQQIQLRTEDSENGDLGPVAPSSGVLEAAIIWYKKFISYGKIFLIFGTLYMTTTNLFVIANVKQLRTGWF